MGSSNGTSSRWTRCQIHIRLLTRLRQIAHTLRLRGFFPRSGNHRAATCQPQQRNRGGDREILTANPVLVNQGRPVDEWMQRSVQSLHRPARKKRRLLRPTCAHIRTMAADRHRAGAGVLGRGLPAQQFRTRNTATTSGRPERLANPRRRRADQPDQPGQREHERSVELLLRHRLSSPCRLAHRTATAKHAAR